MIKTPCLTFSKISFHNFDKSLSLVEKETVVSGSRGRRSRFFFQPVTNGGFIPAHQPAMKRNRCASRRERDFQVHLKKRKRKKKKGRKPLITVIRVGRGAMRINKIN